MTFHKGKASTGPLLSLLYQFVSYYVHYLILYYWALRWLLIFERCKSHCICHPGAEVGSFTAGRRSKHWVACYRSSNITVCNISQVKSLSYPLTITWHYSTTGILLWSALLYCPWQKSCRLGTNWTEVPLKYISNQYFFYKKWLILIPTAFGIILVQKRNCVKTFLSLVKPIESIFAKTKVLSPCHMIHPILD